jgi:dihydroorotate dehydrogenase electron transfer subunit
VNREDCEVLSNTELMPGIFLMWLQAPEIARRARAGQFVMAACGPEQTLRRPISIHSVEHDKFALLYAVVGKGTAHLAHLQNGSKLDVLGPMGNGFQVSPMPAGTLSYLIIAGGIGIAPLRFLVEKVKPWCRQIIVLQGAATAAKLYPKELLPKEISLTAATDDGSAGHKGFVTDLIPSFATTADVIVACGPMPMLKYLAENQTRLKLTGKPVSISLEMRMACGLGVCYGCTIRTKSGLKQVCKDGPVFDLNEVIWDEMSRV